MNYTIADGWRTLRKIRSPDWDILRITSDLFEECGEVYIALTLRWMADEMKWPHYVTLESALTTRKNRYGSPRSEHKEDKYKCGCTWYYDQTTSHPTAGLDRFLFKHLPADRTGLNGLRTYNGGGNWQVYRGGIKESINALLTALETAKRI
jgi:hypothetical protein